MRILYKVIYKFYNMLTMVYHNTANGYAGLPVPGPASFDTLQVPGHVREQDGLFYRDDQLDRADLAVGLQVPDGLATIQSYQYWTELGWKEGHGTYNAVRRFGDKIYEEHRELAEAIHAAENRQGDPRQAREAIIDEAGDSTWCATALACTGAADIDSGFKNLLFRYAMGIQHFDRGDPVEPTWRSHAASLATKYGQLTLGDIDGLIQAGFEPLPGTVMNVFHPSEDQGDADDHLFAMLALGAELRNTTEAQYGWGDELGVPGYIDGSAFRKQAQSVGMLVAGLYLEIAFLLDRTARSGLSEAIAGNVKKLTRRIADGNVDKSDGKRRQP